MSTSRAHYAIAAMLALVLAMLVSYLLNRLGY
jgi:putative flippase GtrA